MKKYARAAMAIAMAVGLMGGTAEGATLTWDANATGAGQTDGAGAWLAASNVWWTGLANVTWTTGSDAVFGWGGAGGAVTLASPTTVNSLTLNSFSGTYTLGTAGQTITLTNGITKNAGGTAATISSPITLGGAQSWLNNSAGLLTVGTGAVGNGGFLLTIGGTGNTTVSSVISGGGGLTKSGAGTNTLSGANTFTGVMTLSSGGGIVSVATLANGGSASGIGQSGNSATNLLLGNGTTLRYTGAAANCDRSFTINGTANGDSATLDASGTGALNLTSTATPAYGATNQTRTLILTGTAIYTNTLAANIADNGTGAVSLNKTGAGLWVLSGNSTYSGGTTGAAGFLLATTTNSLPNCLTAGNVVFNGGTVGVPVGGSDFSTANVDTLLANATKNSGALGLGTSGGDLTQWTTFAVGPGNMGPLGLTKFGSNALILNTANTYTGATAVVAGALQLTHTNAIGSSSALTLLTGSTLALRSDTATTFNMPTSTVPVQAIVTIDVNNNGLGSSNTLTMGTVTVTPPPSFPAIQQRINITGGNGYALRIPTLNWIQPQGNPTRLTLNATNASVVVNQLNYSFGTGSQGIILDGNSTGNVISNASGTSWMTLDKQGTGTWTWGVNLQATGGLGNNSGGISAGTLIVNGSIWFMGSGRFWTMSGGTLCLNSTNAIGNGAFNALTITGGNLDNTSGAPITMTSNPLMSWNGNFTFLGSQGTNSDLYLGTGAVSMAATRIVTVSNALTTLTVGGVISGAGGLTKAGTGTLKLTGTNAYTGLTLITNGTLLVNGSLGTNTVTVTNNATLGGTGKVNGVVFVWANCTNAPGASAGAAPGTFNAASNVTIASGGTLAIEIDDSKTPACDKLSVSNNLNITGATLSVNGTLTLAQYVIATCKALTGTFGVTNGLPGTASIAYSTTNIVINNALDSTPPTPDPMTFSNAPVAVDQTRIAMTATNATDPSTPVQYFFTNTVNGNVRDWSTDTVWTNTGLTPATTYGYMVMARDALLNATAWSATNYAATLADTNAPTPDPMAFSNAPAAMGSYKIAMTASNATDDYSPPVEYWFQNTTNSDNSGWITDTAWTNSGLTADTTYGYQVKARDAVSNETQWSAELTATTPSLDTAPPTPDPMGFAVAPAPVGSFRIAMTASNATDAVSNPCEYFFENTSNSTDSGWISDPVWTNTGLTMGQTYGYRVRARDAVSNMTAFSDVLDATTPTDTIPPAPDPMTWAVEPYMLGGSAVAMTATTATEAVNLPVEYYFENTSNGNNSGWITDTAWTNTGLTPFQTYGYRVQARDAATNVTGWSTEALVTLQSDASGTWNVDADGNWSAPSNWLTTPAGFLPDGVGSNASLTYNITGDRVVTMDATSRTLGSLNLGDANNTHRYTLAASGGAALTLDNGGAAAQINQNATSKGDTLDATLPVQLNGSLNIANAGTNALTVAGPITANSVGTKTISNLGAGAGTVTLSGPIADGSGSVAINQNSSASALVLATANSYTGATTVSVGALRLTDTNALASSSSLVMSNNATLALRSDTGATFNTPTTAVGLSTVVEGATATFDVNNNGSGANQTLKLGGGIRITTSQNLTTTLNGAGSNGYALNVPTLTVANPVSGSPTVILNPTSASITIDALSASPRGGSSIVLTLGGTNTASVVNNGSSATSWMQLNKQGTGTWTWNLNTQVSGGLGNNSGGISAGTLIVNGSLYFQGSGRFWTMSGGTLCLNSTNAIGNGAFNALTITGGNLDNSSGAPITMTSNPLMNWNGNFAFIGSQGTNSDLNLGSGAMTMNASRIVTINSNATLTVGGVISGAGFGLTKAGTGTLALGGASTYTGPTTVSAGTLLVNGSLFTNTVTVSSGGTLGGTGTVYGAVTVNSGGTNAPGASIGAFTAASNVTIAAGGTLAIEIDDTKTPACDTLVVSNNLNISGATLRVTVAGSAGQPAYVIATYGSLTGAFAATNGLPTGYVLVTNYNSGTAIAIVDLVAPTPNPMTIVSAVASAPDAVVVTATNATDPSAPVQYFFTNTVNGIVRGWSTDAVWTNAGLYPSTTYGYQVMARDALSNETQWSAVTNVTTLADTNPPAVPAFTFGPQPESTTSIAMAASATDDYSPPVQYYFENTTNSNFRDWSTNDTWTDTGLTPETTYGYRVKARDAFSNETAWSAVSNATTPAPDFDPPSPDPMVFAVAPVALDQKRIVMEATNATDVSVPVRYFFTNTVNGQTYGWVNGTVWTNAGLTPGTTYGYQVKARDAAGNETAFSETNYAATPADTNAPTPNPMAFAVAPYMLSGSTVAMAATNATDDWSPPVEYWFENTSNGNNSGWITDTAWTNTGLTTFQTYGYQVKARDAFSNETDWSTEAIVTLQSDASGTWNADAAGNWSAPSNWLTTPAGFVPDGVSSNANLTNNISADRTVTMDTTSRTLGRVSLGDADGSARFTLAASGGAALTFDNGGSSAQLNQTATSKGDTLDATLPVQLNGSLNIANAGTNALTVAGPITANSVGTKTIANIGAGAGTVTLGGAIADGSGSVAINQNSSASALVLASANSFTGATTVSIGALRLTHTNALESSSGLTLNTNATLQLRSDSGATFNTPANANTVNTVAEGATASIDVNNNGAGSGNTLTLGGGLRYYGTAGTTRINVTGGNGYGLRLPTLTFCQANNCTLYLIATNAVQVDNLRFSFVGGAAGNLYLDGTNTANAVNSFSFASEYGGQGNWLYVYKQGTGTWTWGGGNTYTLGHFQITAGNLIVTGTLRTFTGGPRDVYLSGGTLHYNNAGAVDSGGGGLLKFQNGNLENSSGAPITTSTYNPGMQWNANFTFLGSQGTNSDLYLGTGAVTMNATRTVTINSNATLTVGGAISGASFGLTKAGSGTLALSGTNAYTGATTINASAGTLQLGSGGAGGALSTNSAISVGSGAIFAVKQSDTVTQGTDFSGAAIAGAGGFRQAGSGTTVLTAANGYTGPTTVSAGALLVNGSLNAASTVAVNAGTPGGTGTVNGAATIANGATLSPGAGGPGTLTLTGGLTLNSGAALAMQLGTVSDLVRVSGGTISGPAAGTVAINVTDAGGLANGAYTLIDWTGATPSSVDVSDFAVTLPAGWIGRLYIAGNKLMLEVRATTTVIMFQ